MSESSTFATQALGAPGSTKPSDELLRALFVNWNVGGHATMHVNLRRTLPAHPNVVASILDLPSPGLSRRLVRAPLPGLGRLDLDLLAAREELALSLGVRRRLTRWPYPYDVLHVYSGSLALLSADLLRGRPSVVSIDSTVEQNYHQLPQRLPTRFTRLGVSLIRPLERRVWDSATLVVAQSEWIARHLRDAFGVPAERLRVIPYGVPVPARVERRPCDAELPEVTFVGTSLKRKGGERLLRCFRERLRGRCTLNLVTREPVEAESGIRVFDDFRPGDPRMVELLARTAVFAFPSEIDKSSYAVLEAMAASVPVVAIRDVGANNELIESGVSGVLVEPADDALAAAILRVLGDPAWGARLGTAARARVLERFDARRTTARLVEVLHEARDLFEHCAPCPVTPARTAASAVDAGMSVARNGARARNVRADRREVAAGRGEARPCDC